MMLEDNIKGSFGMGGITKYMVEMLNEGCFKALIDVQCFDLDAVESITNNPNHMEVSASQYAGVNGSAVNSLDVVLLGATQVDLDFNVNVHTDSNGYIMGGSGGHADTAAGSKLAIIIAPLVRARLPLIVDRVTCITTPGHTVDVVVTQRGIAVNPARADLKEKLVKAEHSPLRELWFGIKMTIPSYISVHFVRHHIGVNHYVQSQRNDRQSNYDRTKAPQDAMVSHIMSINAQELVFMAHKRLCGQADPLTRKVMQEIVKQVAEVNPEFKDVLVPLCGYRNGKCTEFNCCGFNRIYQEDGDPNE